MRKKRNTFINVRFTEEEKQEIQELVDSMDINLSDFMRDAIFSHINFLKQNKGNLEKLELIVVKE